MTWVAVAVAGTAVVGAVVQSNAADEAAGAQTEAAGKSVDAQNRQLALTRGDNAPFLRTGTAANTRLAQLLGIGDTGGEVTYNGQTFDNKEALRSGLRDDYIKQLIATHQLPENPTVEQINAKVSNDAIEHVVDQSLPAQSGGADIGSSPLLRKITQADIEADPVYQSGLKFGLDRGTEGINARATASGMYDSGATLKALTQFGNDYGSTKANESYNRFTNDQNNVFNKLSGVSGTGQVATSQVAAAGTNAANNISNDLTGAGNARAAGIVGGANAWGNAGAGISSAAGNYQNNQTLQALLRKQQNSGNTSSGYSNDQLFAG